MHTLVDTLILLGGSVLAIGVVLWFIHEVKRKRRSDRW